MNIVRRIIRKLSIIAGRKYRAKREISQLLQNDDKMIKGMANVLASARDNIYSSDEKIWIDTIERLRNELCRSDREVSVVDYGAGLACSKPAVKSTGVVSKRIVGDVCKRASKSRKWAGLLFKLIREFRPMACLELGTALGISASYQAAALELNGRGKIITLEGAEAFVPIARDNFDKLGLNRASVVPGRFQDTLQKVLQNNIPFDYVFIDGHHDEKATMNYYHQILPYLSDNAIIVFDDISWSPGMERAWHSICKGKNINISVDLYAIGICIISKAPVKRTKYYKIAI